MSYKDLIAAVLAEAAATSATPPQPLGLLAWVVNIILVFLGMAFLSAGLFLYEAGDQRLQNYLEDAWLIIYSTGERAVASHVRFMQTTAQLATRMFSYLFGDQLVSVRAVAVSMCLSLTIANAWEVLETLATFGTVANEGLNHPAYVLFALTWTLAFAFLAMMTLKYPKYAWITVALAWASAPVFIFVQSLMVEHPDGFQWVDLINATLNAVLDGIPFSLVMLLAVSSQFVFVLLTRRLLEWAGDLHSLAL